MRTKIVIQPGQKFHRLTVVSVAAREKSQVFWNCICECGQRCLATPSSLTSGDKMSCGCWSRERSAMRMSKLNKIHGLSQTAEYKAWRNINKRCHNRASKDYPSYGARGIIVCSEWRSGIGDDYRALHRFISDMGPRPTPRHSIERKDNSGPYSQANCVWATPLEQSNNTRRNVRLTHAGQTLTIAEWSRRTGLRPGTINARLQRGWSEGMALTTPVQNGQ